MRSQIKLGRIFGIGIGLHYSWFLIAFLIVVSLAAQFHTTNPEWGEVTIFALALTTGVLFFFSLLLPGFFPSLFAKSHGLRSGRSRCLRWAASPRSRGTRPAPGRN